MIWNPWFQRQADALDKPSKNRSISRNVERFDRANTDVSQSQESKSQTDVSKALTRRQTHRVQGSGSTPYRVTRLMDPKRSATGRGRIFVGSNLTSNFRG